MHVPEHVHDLLPLRLAFLDLLRGDLRAQDEQERPARRERLVCELLGVRVRDRVVDVLDGRATGDLADLGEDLGGGELAVEHVGCADRLEPRFVVQRGGRDDGRELLELRELDGWSSMG